MIQHSRLKLSCRACETIVQAPLPSLPIERGRPGPGLLAHIAVAKYADGLPLHRQSGIYARDGVDLDRSTMAEWMGRIAALLSPLTEAIGRHVCAGPVLHADDTTVQVLTPGLGRTKTGRLWAAVRDERPFAGTAPPAAFYRYSPNRKGEHAEALLDTCRGFLHADGYAGFNTLFARSEHRHGAAHRGRVLGAPAASSMTSMKPRRRRWPKRRWSASPNCSRSRHGSMAAHRPSAWPYASKMPFRFWPSLKPSCERC